MSIGVLRIPRDEPGIDRDRLRRMRPLDELQLASAFSVSTSDASSSSAVRQAASASGQRRGVARALELPCEYPAQPRVGSGKLGVDSRSPRWNDASALRRLARVAGLAQGARPARYGSMRTRVEVLACGARSARHRPAAARPAGRPSPRGRCRPAGQDVAPRAVEIAGPDVITRRVSISCTVTRTLSPSRRTLPSSTCAHAERLADLAHVEVPALELEGGRARGHAQSRNLRELRRQFLAQAVAEVGVATRRRSCPPAAARRSSGGPGSSGWTAASRHVGCYVERAPPGKARDTAPSARRRRR